MPTLRCDTHLLERILTLPHDVQIVGVTLGPETIDFEVTWPGAPEGGFVQATFVRHDCIGESWVRPEVRISMEIVG